MENKQVYVYILASTRYGTLYVGMTTQLLQRIKQHQREYNPGFTKKYKVKKLVYFEKCPTIHTARKREKQLKWWKRDWKIHLIESVNPEWVDLSHSILRINNGSQHALGQV